MPNLTHWDEGPCIRSFHLLEGHEWVCSPERKLCFPCSEFSNSGIGAANAAKVALPLIEVMPVLAAEPPPPCALNARCSCCKEALHAQPCTISWADDSVFGPQMHMMHCSMPDYASFIGFKHAGEGMKACKQDEHHLLKCVVHLLRAQMAKLLMRT